MGSLADLPYALASTEEDFIAPKNVQALIWKEVVPDLLVGAVAAAMVDREPERAACCGSLSAAGEEFLISSASNAELRAKVIRDSLRSHDTGSHGTDRTRPCRARKAPRHWFRRHYRRRLSILRSNSGRGIRTRSSMWGPAGRELEDLSRKKSVRRQLGPFIGGLRGAASRHWCSATPARF